ncbi:MAG: PD-(D/E)XK nuclease family protein [Spirochaetaceae bacterium]|nr:PD-(D/E)XK nuclease family protein [Spirochaetaceae bacterium]
MSREINIYENLIKNEDTFTEAFVNMLANEDIKNKFISILQIKLNYNNIDFDYSNIETQFINDNYERPDILIKSDNTIIIENKINPYTILTKNQPEGYIQILNNIESKNKKILIFIVPKEYMHTKELKERYYNINKRFNNNMLFRVLYWEEIIKELERISDQKYFLDFIKKAKQFANYKIITLKENDLDNINTAEVDSFIKIFEIMESYKKLMFQEKYKIEEEVNEFSYGLHLIDQNTGDYIIYIGILYDQWRNDGEPLYFGFNDDEYDKKVNKKIRKNINEVKDKYYLKIKDKGTIEEGWEYINIPIERIANSTDPSNEIKKIIMEIIE